MQIFFEEKETFEIILIINSSFYSEKKPRAINSHSKVTELARSCTKTWVNTIFSVSSREDIP